MRLLLLPTLVVTLTLGCLAGCANRTVTQTRNPREIDITEYDRIFEASHQVLRKHHFSVDRSDYRFGTIVTKPQGASTILEFWRNDNTTFEQMLFASANDLRRTVRITLEPWSEEQVRAALIAQRRAALKSETPAAESEASQSDSASESISDESQAVSSESETIPDGSQTLPDESGGAAGVPASAGMSNTNPSGDTSGAGQVIEIITDPGGSTDPAIVGSESGSENASADAGEATSGATSGGGAGAGAPIAPSESHASKTTSSGGDSGGDSGGTGVIPLDAEQTQVVVVEIDEDQPAQVVQVDGLDELDIDFDGPLPKLYGLRVEVMIEVRQQPSQFITNSATSDVLRNLEEVPIELAERNIPAMYWQPVGRDVLLENRLIAAIIRRASELTDLDQYNFIQP